MERCSCRVPARHAVWLLRARIHGHRSPSHGPVRPTHQLLQREDLPGAVVLAGSAWCSDGAGSGPLGLGAAAWARSSTLRPSESQDHGSIACRRRSWCGAWPQDVAPFHRVLPATGRRLRAQTCSQELHRSGSGWHRRGSVGQLPLQAVDQQRPVSYTQRQHNQPQRPSTVNQHRVPRRPRRGVHGTFWHTITNWHNVIQTVASTCLAERAWRFGERSYRRFDLWNRSLNGKAIATLTSM